MPTPQPLPTTCRPSSPLKRLGLGIAAVAGAGTGLGLAWVLLPSPAPAQAKPQSEATTLYRLSTTCSVKGGEAQPCVVEAIDEGDLST